MNGAAVAKWAGEGAWGCEVGRFVLLDDVEANGETWFLARAAALFGADKPEHALALAYSDPMPRVDGAGRLVFRGHYGGIYQSRSCAYLGRGRARLLWIAHDGAVISERALSKLRNGERGARYAYEQLVAKAAPRIRPGEDERIYADRALVEGPFRRMRHRGNHVYAFRLPGAPRALGRALDRGLPYPKLTDRPELL